MSRVQDFSLSYETVNQEGIFSQGDPVVGTVTLTLTKDTKVKYLFVKFKGDVDVRWSEDTGNESETTYHDHKRYFKLKKYFVAEDAADKILPKGSHRFNFEFTIPQQEMPTSFKGAHGQVKYMLEAKMSRSLRWPSTAQKEINFVSKSLGYPIQAMCPQFGSVNKEMGIFSKGQVKMSASVNRKVCSPGDTLSVVAQIHNSSSKNMRPKFSLLQTAVFRAQSHSTTSEKVLYKAIGDNITPNSEITVPCQVEIPNDAIYSFQNCELISLNYYLKVYLDISFAIDPEVVLPLAVIPSNWANHNPEEAVGPYPAAATGGPAYSDFPPHAFPVQPHHDPPGSGVYGYPAPDPTQHVNITTGYNNQLPQQAPPYSFPTASFAPTSAQHQVPTAPPLFQQGEVPPSYTCFTPPSSHDMDDGTHGTDGPDHKR